MTHRSIFISVALAMLPLVARAGFDPAAMREKYVIGATYHLLGYAGVETRNVDGLAGDEILIGSPAMWQLLRWDSAARSFAQLGFFESGYGGRFNGGGLVAVHLAALTAGAPLQVVALAESGYVVSFDLDGTLRSTTWKPAVDAPRWMITGDVDGVPGDEIVIESCNEVSAWKFGAMSPLWRVKTDDCQALLLAQLDRNPGNELVLGHGTVLDAKSGQPRWRYPIGFGYVLTAGDVDGDGVQELIGGKGRQIDVFSVEQQTTVWETFLEYPAGVGALAASDVDGDGRAEIFESDDQHGEVRKIDGMTGVVLQQFSKLGPANFVVVGDLEGNCEKQVIWGKDGNSTALDSFFVTDARTMKTFWSSIPQEMGSSGMAVGDFSGNGKPSVLWTSGDATVERFASFAPTTQTTIDRGWRNDASANYLPVVAAGQLDSDRALEYAAPAHDPDGVINVYDGVTHAVDWSVSVAPRDTLSSVTVGDVNRDGRDDVVVGTGIVYFPADHPQNVTVIDGATHKVLWRTKEAISPVWDFSCVGCVIEVRVADLAMDGTTRVVALAPFHGLYVFDGANGDTLWHSDFSSAVGSVRDAIAFTVGDVDPAPGAEIIVSLAGGQILVVDRNGALLRKTDVSKYGDAESLAVADLDGDGEKELIVAADGGLLVLSARTLEVLWDRGRILPAASEGNQIAVNDIDGDGTPEIIVPSAHSLRIFEYRKASGDSIPPSFDGQSLRVAPPSGCCRVELEWDAASDAASMPVRYRVYRSIAPGFSVTPALRIGETTERSFVDRAPVVAGETLFYAVTAVDAAGNESDAALRVSASAPATCPARRRAASSK